MFEELKLEGEDIRPTAHDKVRLLTGRKMGFEQMSLALEQLSVLVAAKNVHGLVSKLVEIVPEYWPSPEIISLSAVDRHDQTSPSGKSARQFAARRAYLERQQRQPGRAPQHRHPHGSLAGGPRRCQPRRRPQRPAHGPPGTASGIFAVTKGSVGNGAPGGPSG